MIGGRNQLRAFVVQGLREEPAVRDGLDRKHPRRSTPDGDRKVPMELLADIPLDVQGDEAGPVEASIEQRQPGSVERCRNATVDAARILYNTGDAVLVTQPSFMLLGPLRSMGAQAIALAIDELVQETAGRPITDGERAFALAFGTMLANDLAAHVVGASVGVMQNLALLLRAGVNGIAHAAQSICSGKADDKAIKAFFPFPDNPDFRRRSDLVATYAFDAMVFGRNLRVGVWPESVSPALMGKTGTLHAGALPDETGWSSGQAIGATLLFTQLHDRLRDGKLDGKEPPPVRVVWDQLLPRVSNRMHACVSAMRSTMTLPMLGLEVPVPLMFGVSALLGHLLKKETVGGGISGGLMETGGFHGFGHAWGDAKFIREVDEKGLRALRDRPGVSEANRELYQRYLDDRAGWQQAQFDQASRGSLSRAWNTLCDFTLMTALSGMVTEAMVVGRDSGMPFPRMDRGELAALNHASLDNPIVAATVGLATGVAARVATGVFSASPVTVPPAARDARGVNVEHRAQAAEISRTRELVGLVLADAALVGLFAAGQLSGPGLMIAAGAAALGERVDPSALGERLRQAARWLCPSASVVPLPSYGLGNAADEPPVLDRKLAWQANLDVSRSPPPEQSVVVSVLGRRRGTPAAHEAEVQRPSQASLTPSASQLRHQHAATLVGHRVQMRGDRDSTGYGLFARTPLDSEASRTLCFTSHQIPVLESHRLADHEVPGQYAYALATLALERVSPAP